MEASKRLDELAAKFNLYRADNIPSKYWEDKYFADTAPSGLERRGNSSSIPEYLLNMKGVEVGEYFEVRQQTREDFKTKEVTHELYHIESSYMLFASEASDLLMIYLPNWNKDGKFDLHPYFSELRKFHGIDNDLQRKALKDLSKPNKVGAFTDKKVIAWIEYCKEYVSILNGLLEVVNDRNAELEKEREEFIAKLDGAKVIRHSDNACVYVNWGSFQITFEHDKKSKYMSKRVEFRGNTEDVLKIYDKVNS